MKVLFLQLVPNVGHKDEIKEVSDSYARNFLIPKGLAKKLTPDEEKQILLQNKKRDEKRRELVENKHKILEALQGKTLIFQANTLANGKMFGGVKEHDIIKKISKELGIDLEKKNIDMIDGHMKKIGKKDIYIKLGSSMAKVTLIVE